MLLTVLHNIFEIVIKMFVFIFGFVKHHGVLGKLNKFVVDWGTGVWIVFSIGYWCTIGTTEEGNWILGVLELKS